MNKHMSEFKDLLFALKQIRLARKFLAVKVLYVYIVGTCSLVGNVADCLSFLRTQNKGIFM